MQVDLNQLMFILLIASIIISILIAIYYLKGGDNAENKSIVNEA